MAPEDDLSYQPPPDDGIAPETRRRVRPAVIVALGVAVIATATVAWKVVRTDTSAPVVGAPVAPPVTKPP